MSNESYRLRKMARLAGSAGSILDLGCAEIPNPYLRGERVVGLDLNEFAAPGNYTETIVGDVFDLPSPFEADSFDVVVAGEIIEHVERPLDFLRRIRDVLKPGGRLVLSTPNPNSPWERLLTVTLNRRFFYTKDHIILFPQRWLIRIVEMTGFGELRLLSGGIQFPGLGLVPFPRPWCYQTILTAQRS